MKRCYKCDSIINFDHKGNLCLKHFAEAQLTAQTGLSPDDLPDGLPLEDFIDENENLDFDGISAW